VIEPFRWYPKGRENSGILFWLEDNRLDRAFSIAARKFKMELEEKFSSFVAESRLLSSEEQSTFKGFIERMRQLLIKNDNPKFLEEAKKFYAFLSASSLRDLPFGYRSLNRKVGHYLTLILSLIVLIAAFADIGLLLLELHLI
jgi:hypothetical protein